MLKRRTGNRAGWKRVKQQIYNQDVFDTKEFQGYATLIEMKEVTGPLFVNYGEREVCIVDHGFMWLQHFPNKGHYAMTTVFDQKGEIVQWYIDIITKTGTDQNGIPWFEDLYLDVVVLPTGEIIELDQDELEEAYAHGSLEENLYKLALNEKRQLLQKIRLNEFEWLNIVNQHKDLLYNRNATKKDL
ncbi:DUF402 domain-containing protein [Bacillus carboniphilus]|uniref:DUF402 domain-containing protein n=1 Tax=Bacillus carboniphilus TaxID=86663 RepID=A0ABP3FFZ6_9BACI